jgi:hypothetical protein
MACVKCIIGVTTAARNKPYSVVQVCIKKGMQIACARLT